MKLKKSGRIAASFLILIFSCILTGCSGQTKTEKAHSSTDMTYEAHLLDTSDARGSIGIFYTAGENIYFTTSRWDTSSAQGESEEALYQMNLNGDNAREVPIEDLADGAELLSMASDQNGSLYFLLNRYDERQGSNHYELLATDETGTETARRDLAEELSGHQNSTPGKILSNPSGEIAVVTGTTFYLYNKQLEPTADVDVDTGVEAAAVSCDGAFLCGSSDGSGAYVRELNARKNKWWKKYNLDNKNFDSMDSLMNGSGNWDFFYGNNSGIYGYNISEQTSEKLMDYVLSDVMVDNMFEISVTDSDQIVALIMNDQSNIDLIRYDKKNTASDQNRITVTLGGAFLSTAVTRAVVKFNSTNEHYRIELVDYGEDTDRINADIAAGNQPDIIYFNNELPLDSYMQKGLFEDLTPYFDKDPEIGTEHLIPSIYHAMQADRKLYYISPWFTLHTIVGSRKDLDDRAGWTGSEMCSLLKEKGAKVRPFFTQNKNEMLEIFMNVQTEDYINWKTGECWFDSQEFQDLLTLCNSLGTDEPTDYSEDTGSLVSQIQQGNVLFVEGLLNLCDLTVYRELYQEDITAVGYPCQNQNGSSFSFIDRMGIYSGSKVKEGAWEFLRTFMTKEYQRAYEEYEYTPTRQDCYDMQMRAMMATEPYVDELGNDIKPFKVNASMGDIGVEINGIPQQDVEMYTDIVNRTTRTTGYDHTACNIILEEANRYFSGQKNVEETAAIIQQRVSTYVNESR